MALAGLWRPPGRWTDRQSSCITVYETDKNDNDDKTTVNSSTVIFIIHVQRHKVRWPISASLPTQKSATQQFVVLPLTALSQHNELLCCQNHNTTIPTQTPRHNQLLCRDNSQRNKLLCRQKRKQIRNGSWTDTVICRKT